MSSEHQQLLSSWAGGYLSELAGIRPGDLSEYQDEEGHSLAFGAAGIAYVFWRAAHLGNDDRLLDQARRWADAASARADWSRDHDGKAEHSIVFGRPGAAFMRALVAHDLGERAQRDAAIRELVAAGRASRTGSPELFSGTAGCLAGLMTLHHHLGDAIPASAGRDLAEHLVAAAGAERGDFAWGGLGKGLAHGSAGVHLALLSWARRGGGDLPAWFAGSLSRLIESAIEAPGSLCSAEFAGSLCNGFTGLSLAASMAHRALGVAPFHELARAAAGLALETPTRATTLCCGSVGLAFACLALSHSAPAGPWLDRAHDLALASFAADSETDALGLIAGEGGVATLAMVLAHGGDELARGLPVFEV